MMNFSRWRRLPVLVCALAAGSLVASAAADDPPPADPTAAVEATERAFARSMAERDLEAFKVFVSTEAVFLSANSVLRGKDEIIERWSGFFEGPEAPFSWEPSVVEILASGDLALSTGPVRDASGALIATFTSIWRREPTGEWRIVFDRGNEVCAAPDEGTP